MNSMEKLEVIRDMIEARLTYAEKKGDTYGIKHWSKELMECDQLIEKEKGKEDG